MVQCVEKVGGKVRGILWYQGESDVGTDEDATSYAQRFQQAVAAWREALADAKLPVLTVQLNRVYQPADSDADRHWSQVREAQRQVARQTPGIGVVPALDLPLCGSDPHQSRRQHALGRAVGASGFGAGLWPSGSLAGTGFGGGPAAAETASNWSLLPSRAGWTAST